MSTTTIKQVRISDLAISPHNARGTYDEASVGGLADSIATVGLIHPLAVHEDASTSYVLAGGRRMTALKILARDNDNFNEDTLVDVRVYTGTDEELRALSIVENFQNKPMTDIEIYKSVRNAQATKGATMTEEMWAQAFGVSVARMRRILRLANLHPDVFERLENGRYTDNWAKVFAKIADPAEQKAWLDKVDNGEIALHELNRAIGFGNDDHRRMLTLVGRDAYLEAGGLMEEDLFGSEEQARVLSPDILANLVMTKMKEREAELKTLYPSLAFADTPPGGHQSWELRLHPSFPAEVVSQQRVFNNQLYELACELEAGDLANLDALVEAEYHDDEADNYPIITPEEVTALVNAAALKGKKTALRKCIEEQQRVLRDLADLMAQARLDLPDDVVCYLRLTYHGELEEEYYYPSLASKRAAKSLPAEPEAPAAPPKPGEEGFDPDNPPLSGRARDNLKAIRSRTLTRFLTDDADAAALAHCALIFSMAKAHVSITSHGNDLVYGFEGQSLQYTGTNMRHLPPPDVPGLRMTGAEAWETFKTEATEEDLNKLAAWLFALKVSTEKTTFSQPCVADVIGALTIPSLARKYAEPDMDESFFGLFTAKIQRAFLGSIHSQFAIDSNHVKSADMPARLRRFFRVEEDAATKFGMNDGSVDAALSWLPSFLRWSTAPLPGQMRADDIAKQEAYVSAALDEEIDQFTKADEQEADGEDDAGEGWEGDEEE